MVLSTKPTAKLAASVCRIAVVLSLAIGGAKTIAAPATGERGVLATVHPLATNAGMEAFKSGGNAIDAAIAAALTLGVVDGHNSGIGGGCFILLRTADGKLVAIDGREKAPAAATRDMYLVDGKPNTDLSQSGPLASGVPGALAAYTMALDQHGSKKLDELLLPAAEIADEGFPINAYYAARLRATGDVLRRYESSKQILLKADGAAYAAGEILKQSDLAHTYRQIAENGPDWFYQGPFGAAVEQWMSDNGGIMTAEDFANYQSVIREPIVTTYRGYTVVGFPPPSSGGVHVAQILNILEHFDLSSIHEENPAQFVHIVAEAMKLAFADRAYWLGDADFVDVPRGLIDKSYAAQLAERIDPKRAVSVSQHGAPPRAQTDLFGRKHTTHIAAADAAGNWVAITATVNTSFGSKVIIPGTGVIMNNEMDDFSIHPGAANAFGLVGAEANAIAPGKRPLSSMSPTIVLKDGAPVMTVGAAGGPKIISQAVLTIVNRIDLGMELEAAVAAPRFHHQWSPDRLVHERSLGPELAGELTKRGHWLQSAPYMGVTQAVAWLENEQMFTAVHDPRVEGQAAGY